MTNPPEPATDPDIARYTQSIRLAEGLFTSMGVLCSGEQQAYEVLVLTYTLLFLNSTSTKTLEEAADIFSTDFIKQVNQQLEAKKAQLQ